MAFSVTTSQSVRDGSDTHSTTKSHTVESLIKFEESIADEVVHQEIGIAIDVSALQVCSITSDQAITIKTNSSSVPQETIAVAAGQQYLFQAGDAALFSDDVTAFFVSNASGAVATLKVMVGQNLV